MSATTDAGGDKSLATLPDDDLMVGMEDFEASDVAMPRISIVHDEAVFQDSLTNEKFEDFNAIILGLVKQRVLWPAEVGDEAGKPLCKSYNHKVGHPGDGFPWEATDFDQSAFDEEVGLPCDACALKEWDSHPTRKTPWCSEQFTLALMMDISEGDGVFQAPALLTLVRSAIKPTKTYLSSFFRANTPAFTVVTKIALNPEKKGSVKYATPTFTKVGRSEEADYPLFAQNYRSIREFITTPPPPRDDDGDEPPPAASTNTSEAGSSTTDDDDIPF